MSACMEPVTQPATTDSYRVRIGCGLFEIEVSEDLGTAKLFCEGILACTFKYERIHGLYSVVVSVCEKFAELKGFK